MRHVVLQVNGVGIMSLPEGAEDRAWERRRTGLLKLAMHDYLDGQLAKHESPTLADLGLEKYRDQLLDALLTEVLGGKRS